MEVKEKKLRSRGYRFIVDEHGKLSAVILDLKKHGQLWEDLQDVLASRKRSKEPRVSLVEVEARLRKFGKLR